MWRSLLLVNPEKNIVPSVAGAPSGTPIVDHDRALRLCAGSRIGGLGREPAEARNGKGR
jgi:hypothetical protein